jgi:hypothetical protein
MIQDVNIMNKLTLDLNTSVEKEASRSECNNKASDDDGRKVHLGICAVRQHLISKKHLRKSMDWKNDVIPLLGCEYMFTPNIRGMFYNLTYTGVISNTTVYYEGRVTTIAQFNLATQEVAIA